MLQQSPDATSTNATGMEQHILIGLGTARYELKKYAEAATALSELVSKHKNTGYFYEARFLLGKVYRALNRADDAMASLREVFERATDPDLTYRATIELAELEEGRGNKPEALASYQRIALLANPDDPKTRPFLERALAESVRLFGETAQWRDVMDNADHYILLFPSGPHLQDVRKWRAQAAVQIAAQSGVQEAPAGK